MAKRKGSSGSGADRYVTTQANLDRKGKTNKKVKRNPQAASHLTAIGKELREKAAAYAKEHYKKGRKYRKAETPSES